MPLGMSAGRSPRRSHRILVLQPRSCSWRSISPRTSLGGSSSSRPSSARLASTRPDRSGGSAPASAGPAPGDEVQPSLLGSARPGQQFPGDCLRLLADLDPDSIDHALQVGLQPPALPGAPPAPCRAAPAPRGSGISACQLLPILGVSRVAGCGNRYLPRSSPSLSLSLVLDRYSLSLVQPSGADPPRSAGRPHVPPCRAAPTSTTCPSSASRGGALSPPVRLVGRGSPTGSSDLAYGRKAPGGGEPQVLSDNTARNVSVARVMAPRAALVSARALSMTKSWMMAWQRSVVTGTPASRSLSA